MATTKKKSKVVFGEPPPARVQRYDWDKIADTLRSKPGEWAKVFEKDKTSLATSIRINGIRALKPSKGFEVRTENNTRGNPATGEPRMCTMWLRYNPEKDEENN
jgi:hypothetical protein